jgi:hypothetical protein
MLAQLEVKEINSPGLSRTSTDFQGLSSPGIFFFQFKDFPGFSRPVDTLTNELLIKSLRNQIITLFWLDSVSSI